jgi:hypothetical protein
MSLSKSLTSAVAALTVAGAVGLAYAQSTPDTTQPSAPTSADTSQPVTNTTPAPADTSSPTYNAPSGTTSTDTNASSGMSTDLEPKADRN